MAMHPLYRRHVIAQFKSALLLISPQNLNLEKIKKQKLWKEYFFNISSARTKHDCSDLSVLLYWPLGDVEAIYDCVFQNNFANWNLPVKLVFGLCHKTPLMISQHWFR